MKTNILAIALAVLPTVMMAQSNVKKAFDKLVDNPQAKVTESHHLEKDPATKAKVSQYDLYHFTLPSSAASLVKNVEKAFRQDAEDAYSFASGVQSVGSQPLSIAVGNNGDGLVLAQQPGDTFFFACFLDPDDPEHNHRYAYAMDWTEHGDTITGNLAVTYSTTLTYRQQQAVIQQQEIYRQQPPYAIDPLQALMMLDPSLLSVVQNEEQSWFTQFAFFVSCMDDSDLPTRKAVAGRIYDMTNYVDQFKVSEQDLTTARQVLTAMIADSDLSDEVIQYLLRGALTNLAK